MINYFAFPGFKWERASRSPVEYVSAILAIVAKEYGVTISQMKGNCRKRELVRARHESMWLIRRLRPDIKLIHIASYLGGRDHTTVIHAIQSIQAKRSDPSYAFELDRIERDIVETHVMFRPHETLSGNKSYPHNI